jgi:hypothetical protein
VCQEARVEDPEHRTLEYRQGPDPLDPGGAGLRDPSSGEGVAALCLSLVSPLILVGTVKLFTAGMLCVGLPMSLFVACFAIRLAWRGLYEGRLDAVSAWLSIGLLVVTYVALMGWMSSLY